MERNYMIDYVKCIAIFFVVAIHTKTVQGMHLGIVDGNETNFIINTFARFAVPFFFVTSGYLFVQKLDNMKQQHEYAGRKGQFRYFKKYIGKLITLYITWFAFYFAFGLVVHYIETDKSHTALSEIFTGYLDGFSLWNFVYLGSSMPGYHLWFLPALIWATLLLFLFVQMRLLRVLFVISIGLHLFGLFGQSYSFLYDVSLNTRDGIFFALFYVTLGGIMARYASSVHTFAKKITTSSAIIWLGILSCVQILEGVVTLQLYDGKAENYFISTIPLVVILFLVVLKHSQFGKSSVLTKIGANAVGIYVTHVFIIEGIHILMHRMAWSQVEDMLLWKVLFTPIVFMLAFIFYKILQLRKKVAKSDNRKDRVDSPAFRGQAG